MGREIKRVPLDFDWPLNEPWKGFLSPDSLDGALCPGCVRPPRYAGDEPQPGYGYSRRGQELKDLWYGYAPFKPEDNGSTPFLPSDPAIRERAERNVSRSPEFYGTDEWAIQREARRLAAHFNGAWIYHVNADDVAALVLAGRLRDFTHTWDRDREPRWQAIEPPVIPLPAEVNLWSVQGMGHDAINASIVIKARCEREGHPYTCSTCDGHGTVEAYPGQRAEAEAWERTEPPTGEGWQMWENVSEGSPVTPVFPTAEALAQYLTTPEGGEVSGPSRRPMTIEQARGFVGVGWAPSGFITSGGVHNGAEFVGTEAALSGHEEN